MVVRTAEGKNGCHPIGKKEGKDQRKANRMRLVRR